jgi:DNA-directed RNA polymerase specialized sigma24 family protein
MAKPFEIFYMFPVLETNIRVRWQQNKTLSRNIATLQQQIPQLTESSLTRYLLKNVKDSKMAQLHLTAFITWLGHLSALRVGHKLKGLARTSFCSNDLYEDLIQTVFEVALNPDAFFRNFAFDRCPDSVWYFSVKSYVRSKIERLLCDKIREIEGATTFLRTELGLAARSSEKRVLEALRYQGEPESKISYYLLAWKCFQEARSAKLINLNSPGLSQFEAIAQRYNQLRQKSACSTDLAQKLNGVVVEQWLKQIGSAIRIYLDPRIESLDIPDYPDRETPTLRLDSIADSSTDLEVEVLSGLQIQDDIADLKAFLDQLLVKQEAKLHQIPLLKHGYGLVQAQIAAELNLTQSTVSRKYDRCLVDLSKHLREWTQSYYNAGLGSEEDLPVLMQYLGEYLKHYYVECVDLLFQNAFNSLTQPKQVLLQNVSQGLWNNQIITEHQSLELKPKSQPSEIAKQSLMEQVELQTQEHFHLTFKPEGPAREALVERAETWLRNADY